MVPGKLIGIVGPNGCGKSNIIDAIRWVLGESRAGTLRGDSIQDVIFSGSANRKPLGRASVELIFDNALSKLTNQWSSYTEISIKRVVQRDGDSAYYINNTHVRRRDVIDLFLGTGVSSRGYAIIEQGMISRIVEAKPQELRLFLEEAAGISKYRERRHETELRLSDARTNLLRVEDILQELDKQLIHVKEQAATAQHYNTLQARLRQINNLLWLHSREEAANLRAKTEADIERLALSLEKESNSLSETDRNLEEMRVQHYSLNDEYQRAQAAMYAIEAQIARTEQELRHNEENKKNLELQINEAKSQFQKNQLNKKSALDELEFLYSEKDKINGNQIESQQFYEIENNKLPEIEQAFRIAQNELFSIKQKHTVSQETNKLLFSQLTHNEKSINQLNQRQERLTQERDSQIDVNQERIVVLQTKLDQLTLEIESKQVALVEIDDQLIKLDQLGKEKLQVLQNVQQQLTWAKARNDALYQLQQHLESDEALAAWITHNQLDQLPRLWQHIEIEEGWETALESILQGRINTALVSRLEDALTWTECAPGQWGIIEDCVGYENKARSTLSNDLTHTTHKSKFPNSKPLNSIVNFSHSSVGKIIKEWLHGIFTIESVELGLNLRHELAPSERFVTPQGHVISGCSLFFYASQTQFQGVLQRQRELAQNAVLIDQYHQEFLEANTSYSEVEKSNDSCRIARSLLQNELTQLKQDKHDLSLELVKLSEFAQRVNNRNQQIDEELLHISAELQAEHIQKQETELRLAENQAEINQLSSEIDQFKESVESAEHQLINHRQLVQNLSEKWRDIVVLLKDYQNRIIQTENNIDQLHQSSETILGHIEKLQESLCSFENEDLHLRLPEQLNERNRCEQSVINVRQSLEQIVQVIRNGESAKMQSEQTINQIKESLNQIKLKNHEACLIENQFNEKLSESSADVNELLPQLEKIKPAALKTELNQIQAEIAALGLVNLAAIEELQTIQARFAFLDLQSKDLNNAVLTLENAIQQIDRETRERLQDTFERVNIQFNKLFTSVFGGGIAKLTLSSEEILDATIQLIAQPPGKRNNSIHLLSGGEKALTALTLIFSLFQLNPAPFCLLDEVDAPLDDINAMRYCELVKHISSETQCMFISHNKISMQMAEQLIGVTMAEQGVSRIVSVDFDHSRNSVHEQIERLV